MNKKIRKRISTIAIMAMVIALTAGCQKKAESSITGNATADAGKEKVVIRVAHQPGHAQPIIADKQGFFKEEFGDDVEVQLSVFASGPPIIEAFTAGQVDFCFVGDQPAIQGIANGLDIKILASYASTEAGNALIATPKSGIKTLADIKGKKIGYTVGSVGHQLLLKFLVSQNLTEADAELLNLSPADMYASLQAGTIDGAVTWEPYITNSVSEGIATLIQDGTGYKYNVNVIAGSSKFLGENPDITARLLKVFNKAAVWADEHQDEALKIIGEASSLDPAAFEASFSKFNRSLFLDDKKIDSIKETASYLYEQGLIRKEVDVTNIIDTTYLQKAGITE